MFFGRPLRAWFLLLHTFAFPAFICSIPAAEQWTHGVTQIGDKAIIRKTSDLNAETAVSDKSEKVHGRKQHNFPRHIKVEVPELNTSGDTNSPLPPPSTQLSPNIATPSINFTAATVNDCTGYPPDTMGVVGPTQFIIALNGRIRSFNKVTGVKDNGIDADTDVFYSSVETPPVSNNFTTDPRIRYDRLSKRWFIIMIDVPGQAGSLPNRIMLAVSDGSIVTSSTVWSFYQFLGDSSNFADYPTLGIDANALYIGCNMFATSGSGSFKTCNGYVVQKSSILNGGPIVMTKFASLITGHATLTGPYTPQGVDNFDPAATEGYFIGVDFTSSTKLQLRRISNPGSTSPSISANVSVTVPAFISPINPTVKGTTSVIDGLDERLLAAHYRKGCIWTAHQIGVNSSGQSGTSITPDRNGERWYQITNIPTGGTPTVVQSGLVYDNSTSALNYWMGTIMVSGQGHAAMGFTVAGTDHYLDAAATGRYANDASGTMQSIFTYTTSTSAYNPSDTSVSTDPHRWGDYSMTSLDPNDDMTLWTIQEWCQFSQNGFAVQVAKLPAPAPATPVSCNPSTIALGNTTNVVLTGTSTSASGFFDPGTGFSNHIAAVVNGGGLTVNSITYTDPTHITLNITAASNASASARTITVTNPDGQSATSSSAILTAISLQTLTVVASNASRVYGQTNPVFTGTLTGVQAGDNITATFTCSATTNSSVGNYAIIPVLNDPNNRLGNYNVLSTNGTLSITAASLSVSANSASRQYGQTNPLFSGTLVGLQNQDNISATFTSAATTNSAVGNYNITPTLNDPTTKLANYIVTTNNGTLAVTKTPLSLTVNNASRPWGAPNPAFTGTIVGLKNNDNITANYSSTATTNSAVGTYPITFTLSDPNSKLPNYTVTTNNGTITVFNNAPTLTAVADQFTSVGATVSLMISASDPDQPYQTLTFSLDSGAPLGAAIDTNTGAFSWTPGAGTDGTTNPVTVRVTDNAVPSQSATVTFNISVIDRPMLVDMQSASDGSVTLLWKVVSGATYNLQSKNALSDASWSNLSQFTASNASATVSDNPGGNPRFYRLAAGSAVSDPAGVIPMTLLSNSDSYVSIPFTRPIASSGAIASVASNVVTVTGANWTAGQFVYSTGVQSNSYYARFDTGALEGRIYNVITNDANTLTIDLGTDTLDAVAVGDAVSVIPHWTFNSAFPNGNGVLASPAQGNRFTEILFPDNAGSGINLSATKVYYFNAGIWKQVGQGSVNHGDDVLPINSYFIARQNVATNSTMNALGAVVLSKVTLPLRALPATAQDNSIGLLRPSIVTLNSSGLINSGAFEMSPLPGTRTDELLTFDNAVAQKNKSSSAVYYYLTNGWRRVGAGSTDFGDAPILTPGTGFIIRKATNNASVIWTNAP